MSDLIYNSLAHHYHHDGQLWPHVTQVLRGLGLDGMEGVPRYNLEAGAIRGKAVHLACRFMDENRRFAWPNIEAERMFGGYVETYRQFKADFDYQPVATEELVHDHTYEYAGTLDMRGTVWWKRLPDTIIRFIHFAAQQASMGKSSKQTNERIPVVGDRKTGVFQRSTALQLAAYARCIGVKLRMEVSLNEDGGYLRERDVTFYTSPLDERIFLSALAVFNWRNGGGK